MRLELSAIAATAFSAALCGSAQAAVTYGFDCITSGASGCSTGMSQFTMTVDAGSGYALFTFSNTGSLDSAITEIYFDDASPALFSLPPVFDASYGDVSFVFGTASPGNLPGGNSITPNFQATSGLLADVSPPAGLNKNGIDKGEWLRMKLNYVSGTTFNNVIDALGDGSFRVGLHAGSLYPDGNSASFVNLETAMIPIPEPHEYLMLLAGLGLIGIIVMRRNRPSTGDFAI